MNDENTDYYQFVRYNLIEGIPAGDHRVLEVGCAEGATCLEMKKRGLASELVGIEFDQTSADVAAGRLDHVI